MRRRKKQTKIWTISDLVAHLRSKIDDDPLLQTLWVKGEITNFTLHERSGHMYFTLKDEQTRVKAAMFSSQNRRLRFRPQNGDSVFALARLSMYEREGQVQLYVQEMQMSGIGDLYTRFVRLKEQLEQEGYFSAPAKPLPRFPRRVGVVTSASGAVIRDIIITMRQRFPLAEILLFPVAVQGTHAANEIAAGIEVLTQQGDVDVLIVGRGGGSLEELWAFNERQVADSLFRTTLPVISAVGHETDTTISDYVADYRAATPTAAAAMIVPDQIELREQLRLLQYRLIQAQRRVLEQRVQTLTSWQERLQYSGPKAKIQQYVQQVDQWGSMIRDRLDSQIQMKKQRLEHFMSKLRLLSPKGKLSANQERLERLTNRLQLAMNHQFERYREQLMKQIVQLDALSPLKVMQRGYSLAYRYHDQSLVTSVKNVQSGDLLRIRLSDGALKCQVWSTKE